MAPRKQKRVSKRKAGKRQMVRRAKPRQQVYYFKRSFYTPAFITATAGADTTVATSFTLAGLPNASEFTGLYDQYRINGVKLRLMPKGNSSEIASGLTTSGNNISSLASVIDYDDASVPTGGFGQLCQYQSLKITRSDQQHVRYLKPRINAGAINSIAGGVQNKMNTRGWLDCDVTTTEHYGLKFVLERPPIGTIVFDAIVTMYLAFRNVR